MHLHVRGYNDGFCFMLDDKAVSVHEALLANGKPFHKTKLNALNRRNVPSEFTATFERFVTTLHSGLSAASAKSLLLTEYDIHIHDIDYSTLSTTQRLNIMNVYNITKYTAPINKDTVESFIKYLRKF